MTGVVQILLSNPAWKAGVDLQLLKRIGAGGLADVYRYDRSSAESYAIKLYRNPQQIDWQRIFFLIGEFGQGIKAQSGAELISWPIGHITRENSPVGIVLPLFDSTNHQVLDYWIEPPLQKKLEPEQDALPSRIAIINSLASTLASLHNRDIAVVDLKPSNLLVKKDFSIVMLDTDSFGIRRQNSVRFPPTHVSPGYIVPEAYGDNIDVASLWHAQDNYAFAVIAFQILNFGIHPFQCILDHAVPGTETNDDKAKFGLYSYGLARCQVARPVLSSVHSAWPSSLRLLFDRSFTQPSGRPLPAEWRGVLSGILERRQLTRCTAHPQDARHIRFEGMACARCMRDTANATIIASSSKPQNNKSAIALPIEMNNKSFIPPSYHPVMAIIAVPLILFSCGLMLSQPSNSPRIPPTAPSTPSYVAPSNPVRPQNQPQVPSPPQPPAISPFISPPPAQSMAPAPPSTVEIIVDNRPLDRGWRLDRGRRGSQSFCRVYNTGVVGFLSVEFTRYAENSEDVSLTIFHPQMVNSTSISRIFMNGASWDIMAPRVNYPSANYLDNTFLLNISSSIRSEFLRDFQEGVDLSFNSTTGQRIVISLAGSSNAVTETIRICRDFR